MNKKQFEIIATIPRLRDVKGLSQNNLKFLVNEDPINNLPHDLRVLSVNEVVVLLGGHTKHEANPFLHWFVLYFFESKTTKNISLPLPESLRQYQYWEVIKSTISSVDEIHTLERYVDNDGNPFLLKRSITFGGKEIKRVKEALNGSSTLNDCFFEEQTQTWQNILLSEQKAYDLQPWVKSQSPLIRLNVSPLAGLNHQSIMPRIACFALDTSVFQEEVNELIDYKSYLIALYNESTFDVEALEAFENILLAPNQQFMYLSNVMSNENGLYLKINIRGHYKNKASSDCLYLRIPDQYRILRWHLAYVTDSGEFLLLGGQKPSIHSPSDFGSDIRFPNKYATLKYNSQGELMSSNFDANIFEDEDYQELLNKPEFVFPDNLLPENLPEFQEIFLLELKEEVAEVNRWKSSISEEKQEGYNTFKKLQRVTWNYFLKDAVYFPKPSSELWATKNLKDLSDTEQEIWHEQFQKYALYVRQWQQELLDYWYNLKQAHLGASPQETNIISPKHHPRNWYINSEQSFIVLPVYGPKNLFLVKWHLEGIHRENLPKISLHQALHYYLISQYLPENKVNQYHTTINGSPIDIQEINSKHIPEITKLILSEVGKLDIRLLKACPKLTSLILNETLLDYPQALLALPLTSITLNTCVINQEVLEAIYQHPGINSVTLINNQLLAFDFNKFKYPENIQSLTVNNNSLKSIAGIEKLRNLVWLDLAKNQIKDVTPFENAAFKGLQNVDLLHNNIQDITPIYKLSQSSDTAQITIRLHHNPIDTKKAKMLKANYANLEIEYDDDQ